MINYLNIHREEELKNKVASDWFSSFDTTKIIGNVDFCVAVKKLHRSQELFDETESQSFLWAEAKKGKSNIYHSLVQLILTIGKARTFDKALPPFYLGAFDAYQIAFIPYNKIQEIFYQNDFNWTVTPSNYETKEFKQIYEIVKDILEKNYLIFNFQTDKTELQDFIKLNFVLGLKQTNQIQVDKNNFISIYNKWLQKVKPTLAVNWELAKKTSIIDGDFYLADLLSKDNESLKENLFVFLKGDHYEVDKKLDETGMFSSKRTDFNDNQKAHTQFWNRYKRPPKKEYWNYLVDRRDLLVPQDIRERKGSFFTPQIWVEKSQQYLTEVLGENWQDEYYIWDCAAGTGNLLAGLTNKYNIYASTLDQADVDVMKDRIETMNQNSASGNGTNLLADHVFQFDFLNDSFDDPKVPESLQKILKDPEKRKKMVIYINPPYAESGSGVGRNFKDKVATENKTYLKYNDKLGKASNELFAQFFIRIYFEISGCYLSSFSTLKYVQSGNFVKLRNYFLAEFKKGFVVPADTFDNVKGKFPIGFLIWDLSSEKKLDNVVCSVFDRVGIYEGEKKFYSHDKEKGKINDWLRQFFDKNNVAIGIMHNNKNDFQHNIQVRITTDDIKDHTTPITQNNLLQMCIYLTVRHVFEATWLNDRDQFLYPNDGWKDDAEFQNDCLAFALFHGQNRISSKQGINHWIPFTENEVNAREKFESHFMTDFINGKLGDSKTPRPAAQSTPQAGNSAELFASTERSFIPNKPMQFSPEAKAVFDAGLELWKYYHKQPNCNVNSSLYDIREYFQGRNEKGKMNNKSQDEEYTKLISNLRESLKTLAIKIQPKVYEYGFLKN